MSNSVRQHHRVARFLLFGATMALAVAVIAGCAPQAAEADYPTRPIDLVVPFAAGGTSDQTARVLAPYLADRWGQPVNVVNRPGGGGAPGTVEVIQATPDGHTMGILAVSTTVLNPAVQADLPYQWDDPNHVARINVTSLVFVVGADSPYDTLEQFVEALRDDQTQFTFGASGVAGPSTFALSQLAQAAGADPTAIEIVPFDGGAPAATATAGGHVDMVAQNLPEVLELVRGGRLKALAVTTPDRVPELPDVPTTAEAGFPSVNQMGMFGVFGPQGLPAAIVAMWEEAIQEATSDPQFIRELENIGSIPGYQSSSEFRAWAEEQYNEARDLAEELGLRQ
jgi:tripartite-type tricarboxylate transporter receptor subunit TctC